MAILLISVLFVYAIAYMIADTDGPFGVFYKLKKYSKALRCFVCLSVWLSMLVSLATAQDGIDWFIHAFAIAGGAIFLYSLRRD